MSQGTMKTEEEILRVEDVTMTYRIATASSGIKDYLILMARRRIHYRQLQALDHVSFSVKRGESVGIIGTNGSGKSTLLKLVSGALQPTSGRIVTDQDQVRLLTLGSGFDTELTGRENVYLNGSIIGLSRRFLDEHYGEIVAFAELEDFMEEKVRNYSSGMQSRLAFAIATAGPAPGMLLVDEVLSVGDVFFRRKCIDRIRELIGDGTTVLLVSHEMKMIQNYCHRALWIEKGVLRMDGIPKEVCEAYRQMEAGNDA